MVGQPRVATATLDGAAVDVKVAMVGSDLSIALPISQKKRPSLNAGARLLRDWNGVTHVVDVVDGGYLYQGKRHRSLSAIAKVITGAHWSGPRSFGLSIQ